RPLVAFHDPILDPRTVIDEGTGRVVDAGYPLFTDDELRRLEDHYVAGAHLAFRIGFQFVDIKQCHRYLLSELLAAKTRPGPYGGSLENRTRLARNIITRIRSEIPGAVVCTRLNVFDCIPFQRSPGEPGASAPGVPCSHRPPIRS